jgi:hypothetical protein
MRGQGAIVRPRQDGFELWEKQRTRRRAGAHDERARPDARAAAAAAARGGQRLVRRPREFKKARTEHEEALKKYEKEFADYLAWYQKKKDAEKAGAKPPEASAPAPGGNRPCDPHHPANGRAAANRGGAGGGGGGGGGGWRQRTAEGRNQESDGREQRGIRASTRDAARDPRAGSREAGPAEAGPAKAGRCPRPRGPPAPATEKKDEAPKRPS